MEIKCGKCKQEKYDVFLTKCNHYMCINCLVTNYKNKNCKCIVCSKYLFKQNNKDESWDDSTIYYDNIKWFEEEARQCNKETEKK
jgi:hypothetical protein